MKRKTAVVICPGRGTYNKTELGYLHLFHQNKNDLISSIDRYRVQRGQASIWDLDGKSEFSSRDHLPGENSAALIYACSMGDFMDINREKVDIVAVTGNSMGWYLALTCAGALQGLNGTHLINTMGSQMKEQIIGGQIIYPEVDENWVYSEKVSQLIDENINETNRVDGHKVYDSIFFGGYRIIGGNEKGLKRLLKTLPPKEGRYPFRLVGNAAFHTPLLAETSIKAKQELTVDLFSNPDLPLIDGRGKIWMPHSTNINELWDYTLGHQVHKTYDFSKCITVAVKEFVPDYLIITGPGMTIGGAVAQTIIRQELKTFKNKQEFKVIQEQTPYILSMADLKQREFVI